jgi:murein peptide amidase A
MRRLVRPAVLALVMSVLGTTWAVGAQDPARAVVAAAPPHHDAAATSVRVLIGHSVRGRAIWAYRKGSPSAARQVVVLGQMHGDERAGVTTARYIKNHVPVAAGSVVWVVPTMNPDGLAGNTRRNAHDVDLNRNWPTHWVAEDGAGSHALSEPETRAMYRFLRRVQPRFIVSLHQPFGVVSRSDKNLPFVHRLSRQLDLPIERVQVGSCQGAHCPPSPTLTSWYNARQPGFSVTVELPAHPSKWFLTVKAGPGILRATLSWRRPV